MADLIRHELAKRFLIERPFAIEKIGKQATKLFKASFEGYQNVPYQSAQASAAVLVWKDALERANSFDTEKVRDAIAATDMETFYGQIRFSEAGNNIAKPMVLRQIQNGEYKVVAPSKYASDPLVWPREAMY